MEHLLLESLVLLLGDKLFRQHHSRQIHRHLEGCFITK